MGTGGVRLCCSIFSYLFRDILYSWKGLTCKFTMPGTQDEVVAETPETTTETPEPIVAKTVEDVKAKTAEERSADEDKAEEEEESPKKKVKTDAETTEAESTNGTTESKEEST